MKSILNMSHDELMEQHQELPYSSNPNRVGELKLVRSELIRRRNLTLEWMRLHPIIVEKLKLKLPLEPTRRWLLQNGELIDEEEVKHAPVL